MPGLNAKELLADSIPGVMAYFSSLEQRDGGFSAGSYLPPTVEDTYHALRTLRTCSIETGETIAAFFREPCRKHIDFLDSRLAGEPGSVRRLFQLMWCRKLLGGSEGQTSKGTYMMPKDTVRFIAGKARQAGALDELFHAMRIAGLGEEYKAAIGNILGDGWKESFLSVTAPRSVCEFRMRVWLAKSAGIYPGGGQMVWSRWKKWLGRCRNGDGGYGFFPGTTSFVENIYCACQAARVSGWQLTGVSDTVGFIRGCRSTRGGFGRRYQGVAFPESTWYAMASLFHLKSRQFWDVQLLVTQRAGISDLY